MSTSRKAVEGANSRGRILRVAVEEFSNRGFAATRIDEIARRAGANKQLIYYYFGNKAGLYDAVLEEMIEWSKPLWSSLPRGDLKQLVTQLSNVGDRKAATWRRLLAWEGIEYSKRSRRRIHLEGVRTAAYQTLTEILEREKARGAFPSEMNSKVLSLLLTLVSVGPELLPQVTKLITGREADDPTLRQDIQNALFRIIDAAAQREVPMRSKRKTEG